MAEAIDQSKMDITLCILTISHFTLSLALGGSIISPNVLGKQIATGW